MLKRPYARMMPGKCMNISSRDYFLKMNSLKNLLIYLGIDVLGGFFMDEKQSIAGKHRITMDNRRKCSLTGVTDVISFDLNQVLLETELGMLDIKGKDMHVNRVSLEKGEVDISGNVDSMVYTEITDYSKKAESFFTRMFR